VDTYAATQRHERGPCARISVRLARGLRGCVGGLNELIDHPAVHARQLPGSRQYAQNLVCRSPEPRSLSSFASSVGRIRRSPKTLLCPSALNQEIQDAEEQ
jgi:hypothetical protein